MAQWKRAQYAASAATPRLPSSTRVEARFSPTKAPSKARSCHLQRAQVCVFSQPDVGPFTALPANLRQDQCVTAGPRSAFFTILRAPFVQVGPESSLARSKLQVFTQFARAMCPSLPKSPIVMRHVASPKSNSLNVEIKLKLRICPFNCQKSPKINQLITLFLYSHFLLVSLLLATPKHYKQRCWLEFLHLQFNN